MITSYLVVSMLVGWCGTRWPRQLPRGVKPPPPAPDPEPWWLVASIGVFGGLAGGYLATQTFPNEISLVTVSIGAFVGGRVLSDLYAIALPQDPIPARK